MTIRYYLGWFPKQLPQSLIEALHRDMKQTQSLVLISGHPHIAEERGEVECSWLQQAVLTFQSITMINEQMTKAEAKAHIEAVSVIFFLGGDTMAQHAFLHAYELDVAIQKSDAIIIGTSAGAMNMSTHWICSKNFGYNVEQLRVYTGVALDAFSVISHFDLERGLALVRQEMNTLSKRIPMYVSNQNCAVRVEGDAISILGTVYLIENEQMTLLPPTL